MKKPGVGGAAAPPYRFWLTDTFNRTRIILERAGKHHWLMKAKRGRAAVLPAPYTHFQHPPCSAVGATSL
jgi:hypothetical protein